MGVMQQFGQLLELRFLLRLNLKDNARLSYQIGVLKVKKSIDNGR